MSSDTTLLLSRFRGTFIGASLGKMWASRVASFPQTAFWILERNLEFQDRDASNPFGNSLSSEGIAKKLVNRTQRSLNEGEDASITCLEGETAQLDADVWMALLPISLFFHEDNTRLAANLQQVTTSWQFSSEATEAALGGGYAITLALRNNLNPETLLPQTLKFLNDLDRDSLSLQFPSLLQTLLDRGSSLESVKGAIGSQRLAASDVCSRAVALAFYCFLSTPGDLRTSLMRSLQLQYQPQLVATIVGAIAGAYNGYAGIPLSWRVALGPERESRHWQLATQLWAAWSGMCDPTMPLDKLEEMAAVTAPGVMRPR